MQGLSLGWADEDYGVVGGLGYRAGSLKTNGTRMERAFQRQQREDMLKYRDEEA